MSDKHYLATIVLAAACSCSAIPSHAEGLFLEAPMMRVFTCKGPDAAMELYIPQEVALKRNVPNIGLGRTMIGLYALDLSEIGKGKPLEPVRLRSTKDNKGIVVDQFTRKGLKPTTVPIAGGKVDFDARFGAGAECQPYSLGGNPKG